MPLRFVLDENLRGGALWHAIQQHNAAGPKLDVVRVGDPPDLALGSADPDILLWAERAGRILVSRDLRTLPAHLASHLQAGLHSPGILVIRRGSATPDLMFYLEMAASVGVPDDFQDILRFIP
jgi:hypothetical protein